MSLDHGQKTTPPNGLRLILATIGACTVLFGLLGWLISGPVGLLGAALGAVVCGLPAVGCIAIGSMLKPMQMLLVGTVGRMGFAMAAVVVAKVVNPELGFVDFYLWIVLFYLATLFVDTLVLLRTSSAVSEVAK